MESCRAWVERPHAPTHPPEIVRCYLDAGHPGPWHMGYASFTKAYCWPVKPDDEQPER